jgi:hypothetical protein
MPETVPLVLTIPLRRDFRAEIKVPLDMTGIEAWSIAHFLLSHAEGNDPSAAAKYVCCDPATSLPIAE